MKFIAYPVKHVKEGMKKKEFARYFSLCKMNIFCASSGLALVFLYFVDNEMSPEKYNFTEKVFYGYLLLEKDFPLLKLGKILKKSLSISSCQMCFMK